MFKKFIAVFLALVLVLSFAACGKKDPVEEKNTVPVTSEDIPMSEKKIAILAPAGTQFNESVMAAKEIAKEYSGKVIVKEFDNSSVLADNKNSLFEATNQIAADKTIGAVIYSKAARLTNEAILSAKMTNPDLHFICIEPEASVGNLAELSDAVLCVDWVKAADDIVAFAKSQGAKYFLMTSFNRHLSGSSSADNVSLLASTAKSAIGSACKKQGIEFIYHNAPDPISADGKDAVIKSIREGIARYKKNGTLKGSDIAVFSTDYHIQNELLGIADENNYIWIGPSFPTAYNGVGEYLKVALPEKVSDVAAYRDEVKKASAEMTKASIYTYPLEATLLRAAVHIAFDILAGKTDSSNLRERVTMRLTDAAANDKFTSKLFGGYSNVFAVYCPAFESAK